MTRKIVKIIATVEKREIGNFPEYLKTIKQLDYDIEEVTSDPMRKYDFRIVEKDPTRKQTAETVNTLMKKAQEFDCKYMWTVFEELMYDGSTYVESFGKDTNLEELPAPQYIASWSRDLLVRTHKNGIATKILRLPSERDKNYVSEMLSGDILKLLELAPKIAELGLTYPVEGWDGQRETTRVAYGAEALSILGYDEFVKEAETRNLT